MSRSPSPGRITSRCRASARYMSPRNIGSLEPPVPEELGIERCHHHAFAVLRLTGRRCRPAGGRSARRAPERDPAAAAGSYGCFAPRSTPGPVTRQNLSPPGQRILWNSRYRLVAGIALEPAPYLHRGSRVADEGGHRPGRVGDSVGPIGRAQRLAGIRLGCVGRGPWGRRRIAGEAERSARGGQMGVDEEELEPRIGQMLLDAPAHSGPGCRRPRLPGAARPVGALGQPAAVGRAAEEPAVLGHADGQLQPNAFVAGEQGEIAVGGGRADDLESGLRPRGRGRRRSGPDPTAWNSCRSRSSRSRQNSDQRQQMAVTGRRPARPVPRRRP